MIAREEMDKYEKIINEHERKKEVQQIIKGMPVVVPELEKSLTNTAQLDMFAVMA